MQFDKSFLSPYFVTDPERQEAVLEDVHPPGQRQGQRRAPRAGAGEGDAGGRPLLIVAEDVEGEALATLVVNKIRSTFTSVAVKAPGFGERRRAMLQDMAILTGGQVISEDRPQAGERHPRPAGPGRKVVVIKDTTAIVEGAGSEDDVKSHRPDQAGDRRHRLRLGQQLQERLAKLAGGVAVVKVGFATEVELKERSTASRRCRRPGRPSRRASSPAGHRPHPGQFGGVRPQAQGRRGHRRHRPGRCSSRPTGSPHNAGLEGRWPRSRSSETGNVGLNAASGGEDLLVASVIDPAKVIERCRARRRSPACCSPRRSSTSPRRRRPRPCLPAAWWHGWHRQHGGMGF